MKRILTIWNCLERGCKIDKIATYFLKVSIPKILVIKDIQTVI